MFECKDDGLSEKHSAGLFVDGGSYHVRVDGQALPLEARPVRFQLHCRVLRGQESSQILVQNEYHFYLSCEASRSPKDREKQQAMRGFIMNGEKKAVVT